MNVANDNEAPRTYEVREGRMHGQTCFFVTRKDAPRKVGNPERLSLRFPTRDQAHRCMAALIADDRRRA